MSSKVRLTEYSHGAGCGCKISPAILDKMLETKLTQQLDESLLVGNSTRDDAAVYNIGNNIGIISTTDFFMPIVDDPFTFGKIAATNAISDVYAMGGKPIMAIAIFGWPIDKLPPEVGQQVIEGGRQVCQDAGISLAGGHSIDAPEPIFGLAVTGTIQIDKLKPNDAGKVGDQLFLTKPLGIGVLTTAQKKKLIIEEHITLAIDTMCQLNKIGAELSNIKGVNAITDVTGFGLAGHLREVCEGSKVNAILDFDKIPLLSHVNNYLDQGCSPGGAGRNYESFGHVLGDTSKRQQEILCDPQTSGGLLVTVADEGVDEFLRVAQANGLELEAIGFLVEHTAESALITLS